ncbi:hypothetical protein [Streptomyces sp. NBC_00019]|uniref:hypothetical protein n=1 Tax=Streptomyces sp. NBC_00019 TaxID=2975623 RepID=UPI00324577FF
MYGRTAPALAERRSRSRSGASAPPTQAPGSLTILVAAQHPGETSGAIAENPGSRWPDGPGSIPQPSVVTVWAD